MSLYSSLSRGLALVALPLGFVVAQDKQPIVLQHGFNSSGGTWDYTPQRLESEFHSKTYRPSTEWFLRLGWQAGNLLTYMQGFPDTTIIAGHSNGGLLSRAAATVRPFKAIVTIGSPHSGAPAVDNLPSAQLWSELTWDYANAVRSTYNDYPSHNDDVERWFGLAGAVDQMAMSGTIRAATEVFTIVQENGAPVLVTTDMSPQSGFLDSLNSGVSRGLQVLHSPLRYGVRTFVTNAYNYMIWEGVWPAWAEGLSINTDGSILSQMYAYDFYRYYNDTSDPYYVEKVSNALMWFQSYTWLMDLDVMWCGVIGAQTQQWMCTPSDGIIPLERQLWDDRTHELDIGGLAHSQQKDSEQFREALVLFFRANDRVKDRLSVNLSGISNPSSPGDYTYYANASAANGNSISYQWFTSTDGSNFSPTGNSGSQQTLSITWDQVLWVRVIATADGLSVPSTVQIIGPPLYAWTASISGSTHVRPNSSCVWTASTNISSPNYQWYANGDPIGTNSSSVSYSSAVDFVVSVTISNSQGHTKSAQHAVSVNWANGECFY